MSEAPATSHNTPPAETSPAGVEEHELPQTHAQNVQSSVSTYPELPEDWKTGLSLSTYFDMRKNAFVQGRFDDRENDFTEEEREEAWKVVDQAVKTYSDEMVRRWIAEMDTLLVYAGLFSAVLTAFNVESYLLLSPTTPDPVLAAISQISAQLASFSVHDPFVNSTQPAFQPSSVPSNSTSVQKWAVWLNALWFSSLICSLSAASVAIMVKQWIHEYNSGISGTSRHTARLRQHRYNGLVKWKVAAIIAVLPILLQIALGLFLAGLLVLLWNLNHTVAIVASTLVGALLAFTLVTIVLPAVSSNCAYLSPLSLTLYRICRPIFTPIRRLIYKTAHSVYRRAAFESSIRRISGRLSSACSGSLPPSIYAKQTAHVTDNTRTGLDQDVFVTAYSVTGDLGLLQHASTCFSNLFIAGLDDFLTRVHAQNTEYGQPAGPEPSFHWTHYIPLDMASDILLAQASNTLGASGATFNQNASSLQEMTDAYLSLSNAVSGDHRISYVLSNMASVLHNNGNPHPDSFPVGLCLWILSGQLRTAKETSNALTDVVRKRLIAAIHTTLLRIPDAPSPTHQRLDECGLSLQILIFCSPPSTSGTQRGEMAEEDTRWKPLADVIALAEDEVIRTLQSSQFRDQGDWGRYCDMTQFFVHYRHIGLEPLASRVSEKMLRTLVRAVQSLADSELEDWQKSQNHDWLEWLKSLEKERDKQISMRAAKQDEGMRILLGIV